MFGSSKKTVNETINQQWSDQSYKDSSQNTDDSHNQDYEDSFNTYLDGGAIEAGTDLAKFGLDASHKALSAMAESQDSAFEFGSNSMSLIDRLTSNALTKMDSSTSNALSLMSNTVRDQDSVTTEKVIKYLSIGLAIFGIAMAFKGKK